MKKPKIILAVGDGHCIEYAARREYQRLAAIAIEEPGELTAGQEAAMELLLDFLEHADFAFLRSSNELLSGVKNARCVISRNEEGKPIVSAEPIAPDVSDCT